LLLYSILYSANQICLKNITTFNQT